MAKNRCITCAADSGNNRICDDCYQAAFEPCPDCQTPTPTITTLGKKPKTPYCLACRVRRAAPSRRIGVICKVCGERFKALAEADWYYQVCPTCKEIKVPCPVCNEPMPKYIKRGQERKYCSKRCSKLDNPTPSESIIRGQRKRFANHVYKSHQNRIARESLEFRQWRTAVFERDNYTCQDCGKHGGELHPHHIKPFATYPDLRFEVSNGLTLCPKCHRKQHEHVFIGRTHKRDSRQLALPISLG